MENQENNVDEAQNQDQIERNIFIKDEDEEFEDFDGDDTMENMLYLFLYNRKEAALSNWFSLLSFIVFLLINVGCVSLNVYKAFKDDFIHENSTENTTSTNNAAMLNNNFNAKNLKTISFPDSTQNKIILDRQTKILYYTEFSVIMLFGLVAIYYYIILAFNPKLPSALSGAANFTRLVREFSCFSLVPLFNIATLTEIYSDIADTFKKEEIKYADRSKLWDGIWGFGTKDVQKSTEVLDLGSENNENKTTTNVEQESRFKKFKNSKTYLRMVSILIYLGFVFSFIVVILLAVFAFIALYIKTRHVGKFISVETGKNSDNGNYIYKWFNFITFIMNIASLSQQSPAIKLIKYQLQQLTKKAHFNEYRRRKQNRMKSNPNKFDADEDEPGVQAPKIIIHRKKIQRAVDDNEMDEVNLNIEDIDSDRLSPPLLHKASRHSQKSSGSV